MIVGVVGTIGSGKDTVAAHLVAKYGYTRVAFADALKEEVVRVFPRTLEEMGAHGDLVGAAGGLPTPEELVCAKPPLVRALLQEYGIARRAERPAYWVNAWRERVRRLDEDARRARGIQHHTPVPVCVVAPDVRFRNEANVIRWLGGTIWYVTRPGHEPGPDAHVSETDHLAWVQNVASLTLTNTGSVADLWARVDETMEQVDAAF